MRYETYQSLTPEQKEEWNFKYKDNYLPMFPMWGLLLLSLLVCLLAMLYLVLLSYNNHQLGLYLSYLPSYLYLLKISLIIISCEYSFYIIVYLTKKILSIYFLNECKKINEHNLVIENETKRNC